MTFETAVRATEILLALAFVQQSLEHLKTSTDIRWLFLLRILACLALLSGLASIPALVTLALISLVMLHRFQGPYNGGSDRMSLLILWCLLLAQITPSPLWQIVAFAYLAAQLTLSYFISGWVKLLNPEWRSGRALRDVFQFSAYPVSENLRAFSNRPTLCWTMSWAVILFELLLPLSLLHQNLLIAALGIAALFHLANACLFGLNRFFWIWLAAYPSLLWFQWFIFEAT
ncbi:MAG: HTTM domain-containing protein [Rhizobiaceae bacterium]|nr:HTTM domain-containing protein [Hyphomicrobiales bacterium]NRB30966.1 HTTM domain-containing protein [Rhizobiaceae bacterium]